VGPGVHVALRCQRGASLILTGKHSRRWGWDRQRAAPAGLLVLGLLVLAACSDDPDPIAGASSTTAEAAVPTSAPATTPTTQDAATEIVARYNQFWEVRFEANRHPVNPSDPRFGQYATGQQLDNLLTETRQRRDQGLAIRRPDQSVAQRRVKVVDVLAESATLQECSINDGVVYRVATGQVVDDSVVTRSVVATMRRVDGAWKLAETRVVQQWEGVAGCALSGEFS